MFMEESKIYIHYGHKNFDRDLFTEIKNRDYFVKPHGGLWASRINAEYGWKQLVTDNEFFTGKYRDDNCFKFKLKDGARLLVITNDDQLDTLPQQHTPHSNLVFTTCLDFEKLKEEYDAIEVLIYEDKSEIQDNFVDGLYNKLYGWDCDSILVMNKDVIQEID